METPRLHHTLACGGFHRCCAQRAPASSVSHVSGKPHLKTDRVAAPIVANGEIWAVLDQITSLVVYFDAASLEAQCPGVKDGESAWESKAREQRGERGDSGGEHPLFSTLSSIYLANEREGRTCWRTC
ncbi:hypothetical protein Q8A67_025107 [Cirrhinus molitorella]|uniref:Uncharacterized protein n=1 Tax=Cirrhinus molitorella TaxID=172907 RepID=A0AA88NVL3_9TELE|nr:hypothetical protein Q8A67_025107 [Cirrhinus molitorella]